GAAAAEVVGFAARRTPAAALCYSCSMLSPRVEWKPPILPWILSGTEDDPEGGAPRSAARPDQSASPGAATILVVDDDAANLTRRLKADPATAHIPVIAITAYGKAGDDKKAREAGFVEFLSKPVSTRTLPGIVRRHLAAG